MSCNTCYGLTGCPVCQEEPLGVVINCQDCDGTGIHAYYNEDGEEIEKEQYDALPIDAREIEDCETCEGEGWVTYICYPDNE